MTLTIIGAALALLAGLFAQGSRWFRLTSSRNLAQQQVLAVGTRLSQDLRQSLFAAVAVEQPAATDLAIAFPTAYDDSGVYRTVAATGEPEYQTNEAIFRRSGDSTLRLVRNSMGQTFPTASPVAPAAFLTGLASADSQVLARYIKAFTLVGGLTNPLTFRIVVETAVEGSQERKTLEVSSTIRIPR